MLKGNYLTTILRSPKTVFSHTDILLLWGKQGNNSANVRLSYYTKNKDLYRIRKGLYAKDKNYNAIELATRIFTPSYVSFETVLAKESMIFQFYSQIFIASYLTREITIDGQIYSFKKIKDDILTNPNGVEHENNLSIATKERAFLDTLYVNADYYFDNLNNLDWDKVYNILPIYNNKRMQKKVNELHKHTL
jgi:hypothetical protein